MDISIILPTEIFITILILSHKSLLSVYRLVSRNWNIKINIFFNKLLPIKGNELSICIIKDYLNLLSWLLTFGNITIKTRNFKTCLCSGKINTLIQLDKYKSICSFINDDFIFWAIRGNNTKCLDYLNASKKLILTTYHFDFGLRIGSINASEWLLENDCPYSSTTIYISASKKLECLYFIKNKNIGWDYFRVIKWFIIQGNIEFLRIFYDKTEIKKNSRLTYYATFHGRKDILMWLINNNCQIDPGCIFIAKKKNYKEIVFLLENIYNNKRN